MSANGRIGVVVGSSLSATELSEATKGTVVVVDRHGDPPSTPAHRIDHAAVLGELVAAGCTHVLAVGSTGSLRPDWPVGTMVAPDDFFGPWVTPTIHDDHRGHTVPGFDAIWRGAVIDAWHSESALPLVDGGVYVQAVGPRFETPAEIRFFASVGDLVGMTLASECIIAAELGLAYAAVCAVDNLANGMGSAELTPEEHLTGVVANRDRVLAGMQATLSRLAR
jgi:5'-methylthioadenosine phosphorylase